MKLTLITVGLLIIVMIIIFKVIQKTPVNTEANNSNISIYFYSLNDGNQDSLIYYIDYDKKWFDMLDEKYSWDNFDKYDNRYFEYMTVLFDELPKQEKKSIGNKGFIGNLTRGQKMFYNTLVFGGQVDNGGVYQFFFNKPEFAYSVLETLDELNLEPLKTDYEKCLQELLGSVDKLKTRKESFNDATQDWEKRYKSFSDGYKELPSAKKIEEYFYTDENKILFYKTMSDYIDNNLDQFVKTE